MRKQRLREFVWVGGCTTAPAMWAPGPSTLASRGPWGRRCRGTRGPARSREWPWGRRSVHRSAKMASRRRFGAFVYTVATREAPRDDAGGRKSVHRSVKMAFRVRFGAFVYTVGPWAWVVGGLGIAIVYTNGRIGPLRAGLGHLCTLLRRKLRRVARAPQPPWCAGGAPSVATSRLVGKPGSARAAPSRGWRLPETLTHKPPKSQKTAWCRRTRRSVWRTR